MKSGLSRLTLCAIVLVLASSTAWAQEKAPEKAGDAPFAYAAPVFIKELDTKYPAPPPIPPSPPRYGGVLHFPAVIRSVAIFHCSPDFLSDSAKRSIDAGAAVGAAPLARYSKAPSAVMTSALTPRAFVADAASPLPSAAGGFRGVPRP